MTFGLPSDHKVSVVTPKNLMFYNVPQSEVFEQSEVCELVNTHIVNTEIVN